MNSLILKCPQCGQEIEQFYFLTSKPPKYQIQCTCGFELSSENTLDTQEAIDETYEDSLHLPDKAIAAQKAYCEKEGLPLFAPDNGVCWSCNHSIYLNNGYTVKEAKSRWITSCPICHRSFTD